MSRLGLAADAIRAVNGLPVYLGTIAATTAGVDNGNTGTPFTIPTNAAICIETDADVFIGGLSASAVTPGATTTLLKLAGGERMWLVLSEARPVLLARTSSGTASVKVFRSE